MRLQRVGAWDIGSMDGVELFAGGGALAMGLIRAGFRMNALVDHCGHAVSTMRRNARPGVLEVADECIIKGRVEDQDWKRHAGVTILTGGPPCEGAARGGKGKGFDDDRDKWEETIEILGQIMPASFLFEHVSGFTDEKYKEGRDRILDGLRTGAPGSPGYHVIWKLVNLADYGSAQYRRRVILMGFRKDLFPDLPKRVWRDLFGNDPGDYNHKDPCGLFPKPTHSEAVLLWGKWVTGEYWRGHGLEGPRDLTGLPDEIVWREGRDNLRVQTWLSDIAKSGIDPSTLSSPRPGLLPWRTVRDVTWDLGAPNFKNDHVPRDGASFYDGHCGSAYDAPAKALKCGDHGNPGGENSCWFPDGYRYFTVREAARLQGLPDSYVFGVTTRRSGSKRKGDVGMAWMQAVRQLGNAVPVNVAEFFADWMLDRFEEAGHIAPRALRRAAA